MDFVDSIRRNLGRAALLGVLAALTITALAACGSNGAFAGDPTAGTPITTDQSAAAAPTNTPASDAMMEEPTQAPDAASAQATPTQAASSDQSSSGAATQINATLKEWAIDLSQSSVPAGKVTFTVNNTGMMAHNLTVIDSSGAELGATPTFRGAEGAQTLTVDLKAGTYTLICSLPGHAQRGQMTQLTVK